MKGNYAAKSTITSTESDMELNLPETERDSVSVESEKHSKRQTDLSSPIIRYGVPILSMVTGLILLISAIALLENRKLTSGEFYLNSDNEFDIQSRNIFYISVIGLTAGLFQVLMSIVNMAIRRYYSLRKWCVCQLMISGILGVVGTLSYVNGVHEDSLGFAFFYTTVLDCVFCIGMTVLILLP